MISLDKFEGSCLVSGNLMPHGIERKVKAKLWRLLNAPRRYSLDVIVSDLNKRCILDTLVSRQGREIERNLDLICLEVL